MVAITLPAIAESGSSSGGASGYLDVSDGLYSVYNAKLVACNKYNAWNDGSDESQAHRGLAQIPNRRYQTDNWDNDYSLSTVSGSGALSLKSTTHAFTQNIDQIDDGVVRYSLFQNSTFDRCIDVDDTTHNITGITLSTNATSVIGKGNKGYIATSGGNKFLIVASASTLYSYPLDASNNIVTGTVNTYACTTVTYILRRVGVVAAVNQYIWVAQAEETGANASTTFRLLSINSSGVFTSIDTDPGASGAGAGSVQTSVSYFGSYVKNNTAYVVGVPVGWSATEVMTFGSLDLTNTAAVAYTNIYTYASTPFFGSTSTVSVIRMLTVGWNGSNMLVELAGTIYSISGAGLTAVGTCINTRGYVRYRNTLTKLTDGTVNFYSNRSNYSFIFKGKQYGSYKSDIVLNIVEAYLMTGSNEEDDTTALKKINCLDATQSSDALTINVNGSAYDTGVNIIGGNAAILFTEKAVAATSLKFHLSFANSNAKDKKMGFGIYAGTYATPTGGNDISGSITAGADISTSGSFLNLLFT